MARTVLITGAAGKIGSALREHLPRDRYFLRLADLRVPDLPGSADEWWQGDVTDAEFLQRVCAGVDAVVHLGGISREADPEKLLSANVLGTYRLLEAAAAAGVPRVVLASSNHVMGMADVARPTSATPSSRVSSAMGTDAPVRPDTMYAVTKVAAEATGRLFADRYEMGVVCLRIGAFVERPRELRHLVFWLSPADGVRLVEAALRVPAPSFSVVWGVSRNTRGVLSLEEGRSIGYEPRDDAEAYAADLGADGVALGDDPELALIGGRWTREPIGRHNAPPMSTGSGGRQGGEPAR